MSKLSQTLWTILFSALATTACAEARSAEAGAPGATATVRDEAAPPPQPAPADSSFGALILRLSEAGGYFDTDNLISNERSYLHVLETLEQRELRGGAYIGVGPDQNFSYLAELQPDIAFIVDIRRDNVLEHLLFKAIFERARNRFEYLALLTGRGTAGDSSAWVGADIDAVVRAVDALPEDTAVARANVTDALARIAHYGYPLSDDDRATIERFHRTFIADGLDLRFNSFGRAPQPYYPTLRDLVLATDWSGERRSFLASDARFETVRRMQREHRVIPIVGDFAGDHALRGVAALLRDRNAEVTAFYTSNVEYYLLEDRVFEAFAENVAALPWHDDGVIIRSVFRTPSYASLLEHLKPGYGSVQVLQPAASFLDTAAKEGYGSYFDLIVDDVLPPR